MPVCLITAGVQVWSELDPLATHYIPALDLATLIRELAPPLGVQGEPGQQGKIQGIIMSVDIPIHNSNQVGDDRMLLGCPSKPIVKAACT